MWTFHFCTIYSTKYCKKLRFFDILCAANSKKSRNSKKRFEQGFCNLERYLFANFQVKWSENEDWEPFKILFKKLYFWSLFETNNPQIVTPPLFSDHFICKFAQRYFSKWNKTCLGDIFGFLIIFVIYRALQFKK